jgi:hypothetical protein
MIVWDEERLPHLLLFKDTQLVLIFFALSTLSFVFEMLKFEMLSCEHCISDT